ncbi:MAG: trypsin-like peptidase domain-containing protein [Chitinophagaceae bacterium]|nr:trypsin-like peptidase domain-containing protein [Chitinophagaceae bacterium]
MKKSILTLFLLTAVSVISLGQVSFKDLIATNEKAVFSVFTYDDFGVPSGSGTGFFISSNGTGITNFHVLKGASTAIIKLNDKTTYKITQILESNQDADLIKFKIENTDGKIFPLLTIKTTELQKGEKIFVIGNPHGFESSVSEGIVSSLRETEGYEQVIQITAPISPGSSGSPVMTMDGKVIGVATFQYTEGQNLNFAVASKMISKLNVQNKKLTSNTSTNFIVINEQCKENSELILNSIDYQIDKTILNFSFTNVSMGYGEHLLIWTQLNTKDKTFYIQDLNTMEKYFTTGSTIGTSRENGTQVALGETKRFKIYFPPIPKTVSKVNIMEGISSSWSFLNLDLSKFHNIENQQTTDYSRQFALTKLETKDYNEAKLLLSENVENNKADHDAYNIMGIISYILDNNYDALQYFTKAIELNPTNDIYYFNRYTVYYRQKRDFEKALEDISYAIRNRPNQGDYYQHRAFVYMAQKEWKKAATDFDIAINLMGENAYLLKYRGNCKTWLEDFTGACRDWKDAYKLSNYSDTQLKDWISKNCK